MPPKNKPTLTAATDTPPVPGKVVVGAVVGALVLVFGVITAAVFGAEDATGTRVGNGAAYSAEPEQFVLPGLLDDTDVSLAAHAGRPVVVNFFASWCVYCNEELPAFVEVANATEGRVDFIGVNTAETGDGKAMVERFDLPSAGFEVAADIGTEPGSALFAALGGRGLPVTAFYDGNGTLVDFSPGMLTQAQLEQRIADNFDVDVEAPDASAKQAPVIPLIPQGAAELIRSHAGDPTWVSLDVRTPQEYAAGHIPEATNVDFYATDFADRLKDLDRDKSYIVYCASGNRSGQATALMHQMGFKHVYDIQGGAEAWVGQGLPMTR